jgi:hypothetical protein
VETHKGWFKANGLVDDEHKPKKEIRLEMPESARALIQRAPK